MQATPFGRYLLYQKLAIGGTAEIFRAKFLGIEGFEKEVVIKRILPPWSANPHFIAMLIDEAKMMVKLQHEKIVQVYELGKENDLYYISMEYVPGWDLRHLLRQARENSKPFHLSEAIYVISEILKGLDYIHKQKDKHGHNLEIIHRDISPQNILVSFEGNVKIADFGIAHARSRTYQTSTGIIKGKFSYMSPEQARGESLNLKTDLFATGLLLYEMIGLSKLFAGKSDLEVLEKVRNFKSESLGENALVPKEIQKILRRALCEIPRHRYSFAQEFLKDLQDFLPLEEMEKGQKIFQSRLTSLPSQYENEFPPLQETKALAARPQDLSSSQALVSREWNSDTALEITRSLEKAYQDDTDRKLSWNKITSSSRRWKKFAYFAAGILLVGGFSYLFFPSLSSKNLQPLSEPATQNISSPLSQVQPLFITESLPQISSPPVVILPPTKEKILPPKTAEKGLLSVRATPWGKISISGIVSGLEKPFLRRVPYGNYVVNVKYQNDVGEWKTISRSLKIAKASTVCSASFQKNGGAFMNCQ